MAVIYDFLLQLLASYILYALSKRVWIFLIIQSLVMGILYVGNAVKISFFGGPIMPDDIFALPTSASVCLASMFFRKVGGFLLPLFHWQRLSV
ncbi:MAG: phosphoglycerol transferase family protein, alkaline phosphatase superfamily [Methylococcaceae bacterium NSP1-2]|nr:MAG: phosphoglycerol transferase family protein, alkaline phosphatase superfamily [Methylococcaceae bacterium NSP1-2]